MHCNQIYGFSRLLYSVSVYHALDERQTINLGIKSNSSNCIQSYVITAAYSSVSIYKIQSLANCSSLADRKMDMIKNIPVHMDYVGQGRAEKLYQVLYHRLQLVLSITYFTSTRSSLSSSEWLASAGVIRSSSSLRR